MSNIASGKGFVFGEENPRTITFGIAALFLIAVYFFSGMYAGHTDTSHIIIIAGIVGGYMALNIGANDVANNIGPTVGAKAISIKGALVIAAIFEASGAYFAGGDVVSTISKGIIDPSGISDQMVFIWAMMAALLSAALWINIATWVGAPVSTTHSVVGGVMGAGIAAVGMSAVNWSTMGSIAASWIISPMLGGLIAAGFLYFIKHTVLFKEDKVEAAKKWVPVMVSIMAAAFAMYMAMKGLKKIWKAEAWMIWSAAAMGFIVTYFISRPIVQKAAKNIENREKSVAKLFNVPLIFSAALLSFAHGANDVANAVGPLSAIVSAAGEGGMAAKVSIPSWVMLIGGIGISIGLLLFGPKLIRTVGEQITKINQIRAFCIATSASITVIAASWMGLPVSSTHIAVGGVFGVGFLREYLQNRRGNVSSEELDHMSQKELRKIVKHQKRRLVRRNQMFRIAAAWVITVPLAALIAAGIFTILINI